jgi:hypothetical protein
LSSGPHSLTLEPHAQSFFHSSYFSDRVLCFTSGKPWTVILLPSTLTELPLQAYSTMLSLFVEMRVFLAFYSCWPQTSRLSYLSLSRSWNYRHEPKDLLLKTLLKCSTILLTVGTMLYDRPLEFIHLAQLKLYV